MPGPDNAAIRDAAIDLLLGATIPRPSNEEIAERAGVSVEDVSGLFDNDPDTFINHLLRPFVVAVDEELRSVPMSASPTLEEQRHVLEAVVTAATHQRAQLNLFVCLMAHRFADAGRAQVDRFTYQSALRLLGVNYERDTDGMYRVRLAVELLAISMTSQWHDPSDSRQRTLLIDSLLGVLHPPDTSVHRRWTDD